MRSEDDETRSGPREHDESPDDDGLPVGGRARPARRYLAIGELLDTLRPEFPDLTLSKIRFLEQQGLLEPERTPSGYRKFFSGQVERLWWILDQQRDGYVPLKEIRQRLAAAEASGVLSALSSPPSATPDPLASVTRIEPRPSAAVTVIPVNRAEPSQPSAHDLDDTFDTDEVHDDSHDPSLRHAPKEALGESRHPSSVARRVQHAFATMSQTGPHPAGSNKRTGPTDSPPNPSTKAAASPSPSPSPSPSASASRPAVERQTSGSRTVAEDAIATVPPPPGPTPTPSTTGAAAASAVERPPGSANPLLSQYTGASFTFDELVRASGLEPEELRQLESFGLVAGHTVLGAVYFDEDALIAARAAQQFKAFGIEPRHMRIYRTMADRESGFLEQIVSPLVHRRQEAAKLAAADQLEELIALGTQMRLVALRRLLRASLDGR